jgi:hypothetical protein
VTPESTPPTRLLALDEAWLDAAFAATREARVRRVSARADDPRGRARLLVLTGADVAQLRWMLRLRRPAEGCDDDSEWVIELRNTRARVATLRLRASRFVRADGVEAWAELKDGETLARWLSARGFRPPFDAWRSDRGSVLSPRSSNVAAFLAAPRER